MLPQVKTLTKQRAKSPRGARCCCSMKPQRSPSKKSSMARSGQSATLMNVPPPASLRRPSPHPPCSRRQTVNYVCRQGTRCAWRRRSTNRALSPICVPTRCICHNRRSRRRGNASPVCTVQTSSVKSLASTSPSPRAHRKPTKRSVLRGKPSAHLKPQVCQGANWRSTI